MGRNGGQNGSIDKFQDFIFIVEEKIVFNVRNAVNLQPRGYPIFLDAVFVPLKA